MLILAIVLAGSTIWLYRGYSRTQATEGKLTVHFIDVGQGDAALLTFPDGTVAMIDTGTAESSSAVVAYLKRWDIKRIDLLFLSHMHSDHIGGAEALGRAFPVGTVCYAVSEEQPSFSENANISACEALSAEQTLTVGEAMVTVLGPLTLSENENNNSMILRVTYGDCAFLFTGDAEQNEENELLKTCPERLKADVLKVGHHGAATSSSAAFLKAVHPAVAVISASADNSFGHPAPSVLSRLKDAGCSTYTTATEGSITLICDGKTVVRRTGDDYLMLPRAVMMIEKTGLKKWQNFSKILDNFRLNNV